VPAKGLRAGGADDNSALSAQADRRATLKNGCVTRRIDSMALNSSVMNARPERSGHANAACRVSAVSTH